MKVHLDMNKIARGLRAERKGKVVAGGGYFGRRNSLPTSRRVFACPPAEAERRIRTVTERTASSAGAPNPETPGGDYGRYQSAERRERRTDAACSAAAREAD